MPNAFIELTEKPLVRWRQDNDVTSAPYKLCSHLDLCPIVVNMLQHIHTYTKHNQNTKHNQKRVVQPTFSEILPRRSWISGRNTEPQKFAIASPVKDQDIPFGMPYRRSGTPSYRQFQLRPPAHCQL